MDEDEEARVVVTIPPAAVEEPEENVHQFRCCASPRQRKILCGILLVSAIAITQVGAVQLVKNTYTDNFRAPYFIVWFNNSWLILCYPIYLVFHAIANCRNSQKFSDVIRQSGRVFGQDGFQVKNWLIRGGVFAVLSISANYSYLKALEHYSNSDVAAVFASHSAFIFVLSCGLLGYPWISLKIISVCCAVAGVVLIMSTKEFSEPNAYGICLAVASAFIAALYIVLFKKILSDAKPDQVSFLISFIALFNLLFLWPVVLINHFTNFEPVAIYHFPILTNMLVCLLNIIFTFLVNYGAIYTYPLFIAFGGIIGVPLNYLIDWLIRLDTGIHPVALCGTVIILIGFVFITVLPDEFDKRFRAWVTSCGRAQRSSGTGEIPDAEDHHTTAKLLHSNRSEQNIRIVNSADS